MQDAPHAEKMKSLKIDIDHLAHLARLSLTDEEKRQIEPQLADVLRYMEKIAELDVSDVEPTAHALPLTNVTRPDHITSSLSHDEAIQNAPLVAEGLFVVPRIIE